MAEKKPDDLAWETSLLDERITSESQRLDRLVRSLKWALVGAAAMAGEPVQPMAVVGS